MKKILKELLILGVALLVIILQQTDRVLANWDRAPTNINHTTYSQNIHAVRQHDGLVRIGDTVFAATPYHSGGRLEIWKSINNGDSWVSIGYYQTISSASMIIGDDNQIYAFGRSNNHLTMIKFNELSTTLPSSVNIANIGDYNYGGYVTVTATVDEAGRLFVTSHETSGTYSSRDNIVQTVSGDGGQTWSVLKTLKLADSDDGWYNGNCAVATDNDVHCVIGSFQENPREIRVMRSTDHGNSYSDEVLLYSGVMANPHILTKGDNEVFVFAQSEDNPNPGRGLVMNHSINSGITWSGWELIDATCNYFDPTAAIDNNGNIYVAGRRDNGMGEVGTLCGDSSHMGILKSTDNGQSWTVEQWLNNMERAGTQTKLRYQTWHTGGGILEWIWMNDLSGNTPIFYNNNSDIIIAEAGSSDTTPPTLIETTPIPTPTSDSTPDYTFNSNEPGVITYTGDCSSSTTSAVSGNNTITLNTLIDGTYSNCTIIVTDAANNISTALAITAFTVDTTIVADICKDQTTLTGLTTCLKSHIPGSASEGFVVPTGQNITDYHTLITAVLGGTCDDTIIPAGLNSIYTAWPMDKYCVVSEKQMLNGWGTLIINTIPARQISIQIPHPLYDTNTLEQATSIFEEIEARSLVIAGAHRNSNTIDGCQPGYKISDVAHNVDNFFHVATEEIINNTSDTVIQFHGMGASTCSGVDAYITHGTSTAPTITDEATKIRNTFRALDGSVTINIPGDTPTCNLNATSNTAGRFINGSANACSTAATNYNGRFIHIEQKIALRNSAQYTNWSEAIVSAYSATRADVDQNSIINSTDALLTLRNALGLNMNITNWFTATNTGNVNCDGNSNTIDSLLILRNSLGLDMSGTEWCVG